MAEQKIRNAYKNFAFKFSPFLNASKNVGTIDLVDDKNVSDFSPKRFNFYSQVMESIVNSNPEIVKKVFNIVNLFKYKHNKMENDIMEIKKRMDGNKKKIVTMINAYLPEGSPKLDVPQNDDTTVETHENPENRLKYYSSELRKNEQGGGATHQQIINNYLEDLELSPNIDKVNLRDRGIFIVLIFIIRAVALFITEWAIYSGFINSFMQSFSMYFAVYMCIFILVLILTNAHNEDITFFRELFYYVNAGAEDGKGLIRIILQITCILFILPIPYMVKDFRLKDTSPNRILSYTEKSNIYYSVDKFSLYTWILTSIVALSV